MGYPVLASLIFSFFVSPSGTRLKPRGRQDTRCSAKLLSIELDASEDCRPVEYAIVLQISMWTRPAFGVDSLAADYLVPLMFPTVQNSP